MSEWRWAGVAMYRMADFDPEAGEGSVDRVFAVRVRDTTGEYRIHELDASDRVDDPKTMSPEPEWEHVGVCYIGIDLEDPDGSGSVVIVEATPDMKAWRTLDIDPIEG